MRPNRRLTVPSVLSIVAIVAPVASGCTTPEPADAATDAAPADVMSCTEVCRAYDPTACSSTCVYVPDAGNGGVGCTGDPSCAAMSAPSRCCCCLIA